MKYNEARAYVNKNCKSFYLTVNKCRSARLVSHVTEIRFKFRIPHKGVNKLLPHAKILIHWFYFDSVRDVLHELTI